MNAKHYARLQELLDHPIQREYFDLLRKLADHEIRELGPIPLPTLAQAMRFRREQMGESIEEIAKRAGLSRQNWQGIESGQWMVTLADARKLHAIGIPADVILQEP